VTLHHRVEGEGSGGTVLLAGSLGSTLEIWDAQVAALAPTFQVVRCDRRGHGGSPVVAGPTTIDDLGGDLLDLLDSLGLARVSVCGLSLGGLEGMWLAANAPARVERLVLCCTAPVIGVAEVWAERAAAVRAGALPAIADASMERWFTPALRAAEPGVVDRFRAMIAATDPEGYAACCEAIAGADLRPALRGITAPTLVLSGREDPATTPEDCAALAAAIPGARHVTLEGAAHLANVEQPGEFNRLLLEHLTADSGRTTG
jgi:3-oxoadipate enol-lactonase